MSVTISPSSHLALACAIDPFDEASIVGKPAIFALQPGRVQSATSRIKDEIQTEIKPNSNDISSGTLSQALVDGLVGRKSIRDVLLLADRLSSGRPLPSGPLAHVDAATYTRWKSGIAS